MSTKTKWSVKIPAWSVNQINLFNLFVSTDNIRSVLCHSQPVPVFCALHSITFTFTALMEWMLFRKVSISCRG